MNQPKPITEYTRAQVHNIIMEAIIKQGLGFGFYYDSGLTEHKLSISNNLLMDGGRYRISYSFGPNHFSFTTDSLTEWRATA
jgi:hypothetical protein